MRPFNSLHQAMNYSNMSSNPDLGNLTSCMNLSPDSDLTKAWKTMIYCVIIVVSLLGNSLVILVVYKKRRMRTTTNFMIVNMASSDLLMALFAMPPTIRSIYTGEYLLVEGILALLVCKLITFFQQISVAVSILSLTAIAFDRFFAILLPFRQVVTFRATSIIISLIWILGIIFAAPILYTNRIGPIDSDDREAYCHEIWEPLFNSSKAKRDYTLVSFGFLYAVPLTIITILYSAIVIELWRRNSKKFRSNANQRERIERANRKVLKMLLVVVVVFALFWLPIWVFQFMYYVASNRCLIPELVRFIGYFLCQATTALNPLIFAIFSANYREGFKDCLQNVLRCQGRKIFQRTSVSGRHNRSTEI